MQIVREANSMLDKANFSGNARYGFEDYYKVHVRAHLMLLEADQPKSELEKITKFMAKISDQGILADYKSNRNNPELRNNFQALYNHLAEGHRFDHPDGVPARVTRTSRKRTINQVTGGGRGFRGRGRGRFSGGRSNGRYGGRGRGRGNDYGGRGRGRSGRGEAHTGENIGTSLPSDIASNPHQDFDSQTWASFTPQQKQSIGLLRRSIPRNIASMESGDTVSVLTETQPQTENSNGVGNGNRSSNNTRGNSSTAGSAMGSRPGRNN